MNRPLVLLALACSCHAGDERLGTLESRVGALEQKRDEHEAALAKIPAEHKALDERIAALAEHKALDERIAALQASEVKNLATIATLQRDLASAQEQIEILKRPGTMSVDPDAATKGPVGVPACDEYIAKYSKCIDAKVPEAARATMNEAMDQTVKAWKEAAVGPARENLGTACEAALEAAEQATKALGCEW